MRETKRRRVLANRAAKLERQRRRRRGRSYRPWRNLTRDQHEVAKRLTAGQVTMVAICGWGIVADFLVFLDQLRFFALLGIEGKGFQRVMIPIARLILTYQLKILLGIPSMNLVPTKLFRQKALLYLIGYTATQMQVGFCQRGHLEAGPMHRNTLADAMERLTSKELEIVLNGAVKQLARQGFLKKSKGHFALDATDLETTPEYQNAGVKKYTEQKVARDKETGQRRIVEIERLVYGFKVLIVYEVRLRLVVAAKVVQIQEHESKYTLELVRQAIENIGEGVLRVLLIDRGFLDGQDLWVIRHRLGIHFVIPSKDNMRVTADARGLCREAPDGESIFRQERAGKAQPDPEADKGQGKGQGKGQAKAQTKEQGKAQEEGKTGGRKKQAKAPEQPVKVPGQVSVVGIADLTSYDQYGDEEHTKQANRADFVGNALNVVVVTKWEGVAYEVGKEKVFLTSLPVKAPLDVLDQYDLRSLIENTAFRELKQGWFLERYPKKTEAAVRAHVYLTLLTFTLANAFHSDQGQDLAKRGIRRRRAEEERNLIFIVAGNHCAFFEIEEVFILLGVVPEVCLTTTPEQLTRLCGPPSAA